MNSLWKLSRSARSAQHQQWLLEKAAETAADVAAVMHSYDETQLELSDLKAEKGYNVRDTAPTTLRVLHQVATMEIAVNSVKGHLGKGFV